MVDPIFSFDLGQLGTSGFKIRLVRVGLASKIYLTHLNEPNLLVMLGRVGPWPQGPKLGQVGSALREPSRLWPGRASVWPSLQTAPSQKLYSIKIRVQNSVG